MDGALIGSIIGCSVGVSSVIIGTSWRVMVRIGKQDRLIGKLDGKIDGLSAQLNGFEERVDRIDKRINNIADKESQ